MLHQHNVHHKSPWRVQIAMLPIRREYPQDVAPRGHNCLQQRLETKRRNRGQIEAAMAGKKPQRLAEIAKAAGLSKQTIANHIEAMRAEGRIIVEHQHGVAYYQVNAG